MMKGIKNFFRKFQFCAKILSVLCENQHRPKTQDTRLKKGEKVKNTKGKDEKRGENEMVSVVPVR